MEFHGDPYRTLGVTPEASLNEIRSAYRRLVKQYHPDTAGERALPRFLAIQAAYERLVDGEGRLRSAGGEPWKAGPAARRASRDAWRARRSGPGKGTTSTGGTRSSGSTSGSGPRTAGGGQGQRPEGERTRRRAPRKATPGSTSYDEASETPHDPEWDGGSWYGPSMGTYWTINPREYADPRKHGPEYLARARRKAGARPDEGGATPATGTATAASAADAAPDESAEAWAWSGRAKTTTDGDTADWAARAWTYDTSDPAGTTWSPGGAQRRRREPPPYVDPRYAPELPTLEGLLRLGSPTRLLGYARRDRGARGIIAIVGALPLAAAIGVGLGTATGCESYSATCPDAWPLALAAVQLLVLLALLAVPRLAAVAAFATLALAAVAVPVGFLLSVGSGPRSSETKLILLVAIAVAYVGGFVGAAWWLWRRPRAPDPGP